MASGQMTLIVFFAIVAALYFAREVLIPLTLAIMLSILLAPLVGLLRRLRLGRIPAVLLAVMTAVGLILAIGGLIGTQLAELADNVPTYAQTIESKVGTVRSYAADEIASIATRLGYGEVPAKKPPAKPGASAPAQTLPRMLPKPGPQPLPVEVHQPDPSPFDLAARYLSPILSPLGSLAIIFVVAIFILLQQDDLKDRLIRLFGSRDLRRTTVALDDGGRRLSRYFLTQLGINTAFGVIVGTGVMLIGVPSPLLWGVLGGLLRFVPYVGSILAALFPMALAAAIDPGWSMVIWTGGLYFVVEAIAGQLVEPLLYGRSTGLSPISVVVAAIFWSWLWGPIGLILSTPITLCLVVLGRHVDQLAFLDVMLGDRPALTPVESFYQRMLAGDQDEARDHAERLLKDLTLTDYYDTVALPGLELAAVDAERGALSSEQIERIKETIKELVEDLAGHLDRPAVADGTELSLRPAWRDANPVLCIAGRGLLDEAVAAMLCQLLSRHGIGSRIAPYEAATRGNIGLLETGEVAMVCVSYLDISGKHAHLRYLLQRLRQRMPGTPIVVGLWPGDDPAMPGHETRQEIGADFYTGTLDDAVGICLRIGQAVPRAAAEAVSA
jgi:predicted PurR-regulated permease PerM